MTDPADCVGTCGQARSGRSGGPCGGRIAHSESVVASASIRHPVSPAEIQAVLAALIVEKNQLVKANDLAAAEAIGLAIDYWFTRLANQREAAC